MQSWDDRSRDRDKVLLPACSSFQQFDAFQQSLGNRLDVLRVCDRNRLVPE